MMDETIRQRVIAIALYMQKHCATVRQAARFFGLSKSSVHKDMTSRLPLIDPSLAHQVAALMCYNKSVRHLRGGESTRRRYLHLRHDQPHQKA